MPVSPDFREEYHKLLEECLLLVQKSRQYEAICEQYRERKAEANRLLEERGALCTDAERLIDPVTGKVKESAVALVGEDEQLREILISCGELFLQKKGYAELGWNDELTNKMQVVLAIANFRDMEEKILQELGRDQGQQVIYRELQRVLPLEQELGFRFFADDVERLEALLRIKVLYAALGELPITAQENMTQERLSLVTEQGEIFSFVKWAQIQHKGAVYLELELPEELPIGKFKYYRVETTREGVRLLLEEDKTIEQELDERWDRLSVELGKNF